MGRFYASIMRRAVLRWKRLAVCGIWKHASCGVRYWEASGMRCTVLRQGAVRSGDAASELRHRPLRAAPAGPPLFMRATLPIMEPSAAIYGTSAAIPGTQCHSMKGSNADAFAGQMLASLAAASPKLSVTILSQNDVGKVLRSKILVERQPEGAGEGASGSSWRRSSMEHSSRSSPQVLLRADACCCLRASRGGNRGPWR
eukprot:3685178-Rhodomonas_salina.2